LHRNLPSRVRVPVAILARGVAEAAAPLESGRVDVVQERPEAAHVLLDLVPIGWARHESTRFVEHRLTHEQRRMDAQRQCDRIGRPAVDGPLANRGPERQLGEERALSQRGHLDVIDTGIDTFDERGQQIMGERAWERLPAQGQHDGNGLGTAHEDREHSIRGLLLAQDNHRRATGRLQVEGDDVDRLHLVSARSVTNAEWLDRNRAAGGQTSLGRDQELDVSLVTDLCVQDLVVEDLGGLRVEIHPGPFLLDDPIALLGPINGRDGQAVGVLPSGRNPQAGIVGQLGTFGDRSDHRRRVLRQVEHDDSFCMGVDRPYPLRRQPNPQTGVETEATQPTTERRACRRAGSAPSRSGVPGLCAAAHDRGNCPQRPAAVDAYTGDPRFEGIIPDRDDIVGPREAPVSLVEYADHECPLCGTA
jgi:hypothetical protein